LAASHIVLFAAREGTKSKYACDQEQENDRSQSAARLCSDKSEIEKTVHNETVWLVKNYGFDLCWRTDKQVFISVVFVLNDSIPTTNDQSTNLTTVKC